MFNPQPIAPSQAPCKCCGGNSLLFGVVDFNKNCEARRGSPLPLSGIPIYYHRCTRCAFIFTVAFDGFTDQQFLDVIYNAEYALVDPEYAEFRPRGNAEFIKSQFSRDKSISILDYGGGNGLLASLLRADGFTNVDTYDPFVKDFAKRPGERYDCIICFEVMEHSNRPRQSTQEINALLKPDGLLLFSTLLQPPDIDAAGVGWWYIAPRNGHVSLYSEPALASLLNPLGLQLGSFSSNLHIAFRKMPAFAQHFVGAPRAQA
jgi:2-polyprenyl-6-hydroxyphenyl methylase/3-demethylubiquinone-9 3-methyltransferase